MRRVWWRPSHWWVLNPARTASVLTMTPRVTGAVISGKKRRQPLQSERQKVSKRAPPQANPPLLKPSGPSPLRSRRTWGGLESRRPRGVCCVVKVTTTPTPNPKPTPQPVTEAPSQPKVTATRQKAGPKKSKPKSPAATKPATGKAKRKHPRVSRPRPPNPQPLNWWSPTNFPPSTRRNF